MADRPAKELMNYFLVASGLKAEATLPERSQTTAGGVNPHHVVPPVPRPPNGFGLKVTIRWAFTRTSLVHGRARDLLVHRESGGST
jgi:hypothetical protein